MIDLYGEWMIDGNTLTGRPQASAVALSFQNLYAQMHKGVIKPRIKFGNGAWRSDDEERDRISPVF